MKSWIIRWGIGVLSAGIVVGVLALLQPASIRSFTTTSISIAIPIRLTHTPITHPASIKPPVPIKPSAPIKSPTPIKSSKPIKSSTRIKSFTPINASRPIKSLAPIKSPEPSKSPPSGIAVESSVSLAPYRGRFQFLAYVAPVYPEMAELSEIEGSVRFRVFVDKTGRITKFMPLAGDDQFGFMTAVKRAVRHWRIEPITVDGKPVAFYIDQQYDFILSR